MTDAAPAVSRPVMAYDSYNSNADLIAAAARLGYLRVEWSTLDPTHGYGVWWRKWRPDFLIRHDLSPRKAPDGPADFTRLPYRDRGFDVVALDPPYKLNGTPTEEVDEPYGVHVPTRWQDRMALCEDGIRECARVARLRLLVKCQDQVVSGAVRWQTRIFADVAEACGMRMVDHLLMESYRPQPATRPCKPCGGLGILGDLGRCGNCEGYGVVPAQQVHARRNYSSLLVFERAR